MNLPDHLQHLGSSGKEPPTEHDLLVAARVLMDAAPRLAGDERAACRRVAEFAQEVAPTVGLLSAMAEAGTLPDMGSLLGP